MVKRDDLTEEEKRNLISDEYDIMDNIAEVHTTGDAKALGITRDDIWSNTNQDERKFIRKQRDLLPKIQNYLKNMMEHIKDDDRKDEKTKEREIAKIASLSESIKTMFTSQITNMNITSRSEGGFMLKTYSKGIFGKAEEEKKRTILERLPSIFGGKSKEDEERGT